MNETPKPTDNVAYEKPRIPMSVMWIILACGAISAILWFGVSKLASSSIFFATETPTATATFTPTSMPSATPTRTPRPTPTATPPPAWVTNFAEPILGAIKNREPDFQDDFSFDTKRWYQLYDPGTLVIEKGVMRLMRGKGQPGGVGASNYYFLKKPNIVFQVDITRPTTCCLFVDVSRRPHNGIYLGSDLEWGVTGGGKRVYEGSAPLRSTIQVLIIVRGSQIGYYLNGVPVAYYEDLALLNDTRNERSFYCDTFCEFDNVKVWNLDNIPNLP